MPNNTPITDAELAKVKRLVAAATPGEWRGGLHYLHDVPYEGLDYCELITPEAAMVGFFKRADVKSAATLHNAFGPLIARLEAAERDRDTAKAEVARQWITMTEIAELVEDYADCDDSEEGIANHPNLAMQVQMMTDKATQCNPQAYAWLAARDSQHRREGAAEWLENAAREGGYYERSSEGMLEEAKQLREGGE